MARARGSAARAGLGGRPAPGHALARPPFWRHGISDCGPLSRRATFRRERLGLAGACRWRPPGALRAA
eukprot:3692749-Lingulodinium_polyedra.AAC.1